MITMIDRSVMYEVKHLFSLQSYDKSNQIFAVMYTAPYTGAETQRKE